jgi:hypothetical protein
MSKKLIEVVCTCDRLPLPSGQVLVRDQKAKMSLHDAKNYESAGRVARV